MLWSATFPLLRQVFKGPNVTWPKEEVVITDKGMVERCLFPAPSLQLCLFHTLQPISRQVNIETAIEACITRRWAV